MDKQAFDLWLEFEQWVPSEGEDPENDFFNMGIHLKPNGVSYALNVWTFKFLETDRRDRQQNSENLGGKYLLPSDLFVERLDRPLLEEIVADLIRTNRLRDEWIIEKSQET